MEIKDAFLDLGKGKKLHYYFSGRGRPLVLLHGAASSPRTFWPQLPELSQKFFCLLPALPGHGKSYPITEESSLSDLTTTLHLLVRRLSLAKVSLLGYSLGAAVAVDFVLTHPTLVEKLIIVDGLVLKHSLPYHQIIPAIAEDYVSDTAAALQRGVAVRTLTAERLERHLRGYSFLQRLAETVDFEKKLREIKVPTLILWGKKDRVIPLSDGYKIHYGIKGSLFKVFPGGHTWKRAHPEILARTVSDFLHP